MSKPQPLHCECPRCYLGFYTTPTPEEIADWILSADRIDVATVIALLAEGGLSFRLEDKRNGRDKAKTS